MKTARRELEDQQMAFLRELGIERCVPDAAFDRIARLAADLFDVPMAFVTLIGAERQWLTAKIGTDLEDLTPHHDLCAHTLARPDGLIVPDARQDPLFRDTALVAGPSAVRFFAGASLRSGNEGRRIGAVCILDRKPRHDFSKRDHDRLKSLAEMAMGEFDRRQLRCTSSIAKGFADRTSDIFVCTQSDGRIIYVNQAAECLFGYAPTEMIDRDIAMIIPERFRAAHKQGVARVAAGEAPKLAGKTIEAIGLHKDGHEIWIDLTLNVWHDENGINIGATIRDITKRKAKIEGLKRLAHLDTLTGLARGHAFQDQIAQLLEIEGRAAVLVMQIEGLVDVNSSLGNRIGDALLQAVAIRLVASVPAGSRVARWGGDIFAVLLNGMVTERAIVETAQDLQMALAEPFALDGHTIVIGAAVGAAAAPAHAREAAELIAAADLALHQAKLDRGRRFRIFDLRMEATSRRRRALRDEVRLGLDAEQFELFYQPQVSLTTGALIAAEALMRWRHPVKGLLGPAAFIPAMDDSSLALQAGWWTLDQACRRIAARRAMGLPMMRISVNLFAAQLRYGGLVATVRDLLSAHAVPPEFLELEVRESIAGQDDDAAISVLAALRDLGVKIALDDFGTGYASLKTLRCLPVSTIKIDQSFVCNMCDDRRDAAIVEAVLGVGRNFGLDVIAEGVETQSQAALLAKMGCPIAQGHLYGRALPVAAFETQWAASPVSAIFQAQSEHSSAMMVANRGRHR